MECPQSHFFRLIGIDHTRQTFTHFGGGFVGKGEPQDLFGKYAAAEHIGNTAGDDPCLTGSGAREDKDGTFQSLYSFGLFRIETCDDLFFFHWHKSFIGECKKIFYSI